MSSPINSYTGKIHHGISTVSAVFYNSARNEEYCLDERSVSDDVSARAGESREMYVQAMKDIQDYKTKHGIELDHLPVDEWVNDNEKLSLD